MSERKHFCSDSQQPQQKDLLSQALSCAANAVFITDGVGCIIWANDAFNRLSGYSPDEAIGKTPAIMKSGMQSNSFYEDLWQTILAGEVWRGTMIDRGKDGTLYTVDETITPLFNEHGSIDHFLAVQNDITLRKPEDVQNCYLAYHDVLTGLPNRAFFLDIQQQAIADAKRNAHQFALMFLDIDKFKTINDTFGHSIGDQLLVAVAERLRTVIRKADTVARLGGDEFVIFLSDFFDKEIVTMLARKLIDTLSQPFLLEGKIIQTTASIGISLYPTDSQQAEELMMKADKAMYAAKTLGCNHYQFYDAIIATDSNNSD